MFSKANKNETPSTNYLANTNQSLKQSQSQNMGIGGNTDQVNAAYQTSPKAAQMMALEGTLNNSDKTTQLMSINDTLNSSPKAQGITQWQGKLNSYSGHAAHEAQGGQIVQKKSDDTAQLQGDPKKEDIVYSSGFSNETISGVEVKGEYFNAYKGRDGKYYKRNVAKIIKTTKAKWKEILKNADHGYYMYHQWIFGFLKANVNGLRSFPFVPNQAVISAPNSGPLYCELYDASPYTDREKLDFLEALYGIGEKKNEVDLPNGYNTEGGLSTEKTFFPMMSRFVEHNQPLLVKSVSSSSSPRMDSAADNIKTLADEATPQGVFSVGKPEVAISMIQSAYGSALSAAKSLLNISIQGVNKGNFDKVMDESDVVYNSGLIINNTIKAYTGVVEKVNKNKETAFDIAWGAIPFGKNFPEAAKEPLKVATKAIYTNLFNTKHDDVSGLKNTMKSEFGKLKDEVKKILKGLEKDGHNVDYGELANSFAAMKNTFDAGLDD